MLMFGKLIDTLVNNKKEFSVSAGVFGGILIILFLLPKFVLATNGFLSSIIAIGMAVASVVASVALVYLGLLGVAHLREKLLEEQTNRANAKHAESQRGGRSNWNLNSSSQAFINPRIEQVIDPRDYKFESLENNNEGSTEKVPEKKRTGLLTFLKWAIPVFLLASSVIAGYYFFISPGPNKSVSTIDSDLDKNINQKPKNSNVDQKNNQEQTKSEEIIKEAVKEEPEILQKDILEYSYISPDVEQILLKGWKKKKIGGAISLATTNRQFTNHNGKYLIPEQLGLEKVVHNKSLVRRALNDELIIESINIGQGKDTPFEVTLLLTNLNDHKVEFLIERGQIFESSGQNKVSPIKIQSSNTDENKTETDQNPGQVLPDSEEDRTFIVPPRAVKFLIKVKAYCYNKGYPRPYGEAYLALWKVKDSDFKDQGDLHRRVGILIDTARKNF